MLGVPRLETVDRFGTGRVNLVRGRRRGRRNSGIPELFSGLPPFQVSRCMPGSHGFPSGVDIDARRTRSLLSYQSLLQPIHTMLSKTFVKVRRRWAGKPHIELGHEHV